MKKLLSGYWKKYSIGNQYKKAFDAGFIGHNYKLIL